jgi:hypothetical protein
MNDYIHTSKVFGSCMLLTPKHVTVMKGLRNSLSTPAGKRERLCVFSCVRLKAEKNTIELRTSNKYGSVTALKQ